MSGRSNKQTDNVLALSDNVAQIPAEHFNDVLVAGAAAITNIDNVINELRAARDYLEAEAERVWRANARYAHLAKTASASAKSITESMGKWRNPERLNAPPSLDSSKNLEGQPKAIQKIASRPIGNHQTDIRRVRRS